MRPAWKITVWVLCFVSPAGSLFAQDATPSEKRFLKALTTGLSDKSPEVQRAAAEALVVMGRKAAAQLLRVLKRLRPQARDRAVDVLVQIGQASLDEIGRLKKPPGGKAGEAIREVRRRLEGEGGIAGFGTPDPMVRLKIEAILREMPLDSFASDDPHLKDVEVLGRPAIPVLLDYLNPAQGHRMGFRDEIASAVLAHLCTGEDTPKLCRLLDLGWLRVSSVLVAIGDRSCVPAFVRAMGRGRMSWEFARALWVLDDARIDKALIRFLEAHGSGFPDGTSTLLDTVAERGLKQVLPALRRMRGSARKGRVNAVSNEVALGRALAVLGDPSGIPLLIRHLDPPRQERWAGDRALQALDAVTGSAVRTPAKDRPALKAAYSAWWEANQGRLVWDPGMRRFKVED